MIRKYKQSDKDALLDIFQMNTPKYFDPEEINDFIDYLTKYSDTYLTIEKDNKVVGGTGYYINKEDKSGRITWIFFHPDYAGFGLGKQAVEYCMQELKLNKHINKLVVTTSQLAYQFFEKFGFELIRTEKDYWGKGLDLYLMEIQL